MNLNKKNKNKFVCLYYRHTYVYISIIYHSNISNDSFGKSITHSDNCIQSNNIIIYMSI